MMSSLPIRHLSFVAALSLLGGLSPTIAQNDAADLPPEIAPLAAKYQADLDALAQSKSKAMATVRQPYLTALAAVEKSATNEGKNDVLKAVTDEKEAVIAGQALANTATPLLPRTLATPRAALMKESARLDHDYALRAQQAAAEYLRGLVFFEGRARTGSQTVLLQKIDAEKARITGRSAASPNAGPSSGKSIVLNGDFSQKDENGMAENWKLGGKSQGAVTTEHGITFLRFVNPNAKKNAFFQSVDRPADAREVLISVRIRSGADLTGHGEYGFLIWQLDAQDKQITRDMPVRLTAPAPAWATYSGAVKLVPEAKKIMFRGIIDNGLTGSVDFAELRGEVR